MIKTVTLFSFIMVFLSCTDFGANKLNIAASSNTQHAIREIAKEFEKEFETKVNVIVGSSGKLTSQIKQGAPYDVFVSADLLYPQDLYETGFTTDLPEVYAYGKLICWTTKKGIDPVIPSFTDSKIKKIAIGNPKLAPYGRLAQSAIEHFGILDEVREKLVFGENIAQTTQFIQTGAADIGITSISMVKKIKKGKGSWQELPKESYLPIAQGSVIINRSKHEYSAAFYKFLFSDKAQIILESYGFTVDLSK
jgi:molybdate transport system substrate-binding protein